jgi:hypothetical protein
MLLEVVYTCCHLFMMYFLLVCIVILWLSLCFLSTTCNILLALALEHFLEFIGLFHTNWCKVQLQFFKGVFFVLFVIKSLVLTIFLSIS